MLLALADATHPDHQDLLEWVGEFDPEAFDAAASNKSIAEARRHYRKRR